jgi:ABC-type polysaccharide/polyol phosphate transport system ATPase subunit
MVLEGFRVEYSYKRMVIAFDHVELWRRTQEEYSYDLKRTIFAVIERRYRAPKRRRILRDISFHVGAGEKVALIGPNGSGKSTTLKVTAGILKPTSGTVTVSGSIAPLIELGAGFDPDLSVVENIQYYGVLLGRERKAVRASVDAILDFAGLFDHATEPLKALSSGMIARLGFAIATDVRPDILILDEVLAVGDETFRRRSSERLMRFWDERSTILVVSHDTAFVRSMCERAILLEEGELLADGPASDVADLYAERIGAQAVVSGHSAEHFTAQAIVAMDGSLFRGNGTVSEEQKIFLIRGGKKHWVIYGDWLAKNGYSWPQDVNFVEGGVLAEIPDGELINLNDPPPTVAAPEELLSAAQRET